jgi:hypothetical protein
MLASPKGKNGFVETESLPLPSMQTKQSKIVWIDASVGGSQGHSFAEVLQSKPCFELKGQSSLCMDLLLVTTRSEVGNDEFDQLSAVDCLIWKSILRWRLALWLL